VRATSHAKLIGLPGDDHDLTSTHGSSVLRAAFLALAGGAAIEDGGARATEVGGLPLVEVPSPTPAGDLLAIIVSGDGGWASIDRDIGKTLAARGVPVAGLNSLRYFWTRRTPAGAAADLDRIARHYLAAWGRERLLLIGYSRGADVLPFMASRLPDDLRRRVALVVLMGPEPTVDFTFHLSDWIGGTERASDLFVQPEIEKLRGLRLLCIYGQDEDDSVCPHLDAALATRVALPGGHHFGGGYDAIAARILDAAQPGS
jgi:type IV secretory pathway VirJ component